ncbi:hypothetical protein MAR_025481 [Mya arenaria]|uniref:Mab-21-like nucleotidyltransferase domain-containing protein n=1 Tax=Mya arenaria TaxID=6604 RepID=A0ABY7ERF4_MYAAR|nr:hypothetical protein MAR_025481 [Mya arenaria]
MALTFGGISYVDVVQARNIEISQQNWKSSARIVDAVMHLFLKGLRYHASEYNGLVIEQYITQGSARDGLKVIAADEFDTMIFFRISELWKYIDPIRDKKDPSFCRMKVVGLTGSQIQQRFPRLCKERVFIITHSGDIYLSAKAMHEQVFKSIIDKTIAIINSLETAWINEFQLTRKMNPPAINIIVRNHSATRSIAIDFVPAVCIDMQSVKFRGSVRKFPVFAVCKWQGKRDSYCHTWSVKSNSYENALINAARKDERGLFVLNALRSTRHEIDRFYVTDLSARKATKTTTTTRTTRTTTKTVSTTVSNTSTTDTSQKSQSVFLSVVKQSSQNPVKSHTTIFKRNIVPEKQAERN